MVLFGSLQLVREPTLFLEAANHIGGLVTIAILGLVVLALPRRHAPPWPVDQPAAAVGLVVIGLLTVSLIVRVRPTLTDTAIVVLVVLIGTICALVTATRIRAVVNPPRHRLLMLVAAGLVLLAVLGALAVGQPVLAGFSAVAGLAGAVWLTGASIAARFVGLMVLAAASVGVGTEVVFIADDLLGTAAYRMNTVFKFYNQIWVLLALAGAALVTQMIFDARWLPSPSKAPIASWLAAAPVRSGWSRIGVIVSAVVIAGSLTYPLFATLPRLSQRFEPGLSSGTLNALDWMNDGTIPVLGPGGPETLSFADDRAAIDWLNRNVPGSPVIAEASIGPYRCNGSRISIATGLPTIIGWERHQQQQRDPLVLPERVQDVRTLYTSANVQEKEAILRKYNVAYVVVGELERYYIVPSGNECQATGNPAGIAAFDDMVGDVLEVAFEQGDTTIYRVLPVVDQAVMSRPEARHALA